jgi:hypothetical protein
MPYRESAMSEDWKASAGSGRREIQIFEGENPSPMQENPNPAKEIQIFRFEILGFQTFPARGRRGGVAQMADIRQLRCERVKSTLNRRLAPASFWDLRSEPAFRPAPAVTRKKSQTAVHSCKRFIAGSSFCCWPRVNWRRLYVPSALYADTPQSVGHGRSGRRFQCLPYCS